ncbi:MAG: LpqB family beta-propeller domain-containing protein, partial [Acidobacteriota bacterium]
MGTFGTFRIGDFEVEPSLNRLRRGREVLSVEPRVMDLLVVLAESPGQVFGRDEILRRVWPETAVQDDALRRAVTLLRRVLEDDPKKPRYIETITRRGYRLVAPVSRPEPEPEPEPAPRPTDAAATGEPWPSRAAPLGFGLLLLLGLALTFGQRARTERSPEAQPEIRPFTSLPGHESEPAFSADGASVAFIHQHEGESALMVKDLEDGGARRILQHPELSSPAWSPDGERVLVTTQGEGCAILAAEVHGSREAESLYSCSDGESVDDVHQPDGKTLIFGRRPARFGSPWRVHRYDLVTRESMQLTLPAEPGSGDIFLALSPDRRKVAVIRHLVGQRSRLLILDWASGEQRVIDHFPDTAWRVAWSPDGESLVFAYETGLYRLGLRGGEPQRLLSSPRDLRQPSSSPVGQRMAVVDQRAFANIVR